MNTLSVTALLIAILGAHSQVKDYCPDNLCTGDYYENRETDECFSDHNCQYGRKCCKGCTYNICVEPIFKEYVVGNGELMRDKFCPKVKKCYTPLKYDVRYRCGSDEACTFGYKCCWSDCYIHRVCVAPTDKEGNQVLPPQTTTTVASITRPPPELPETTQTSTKEEDKTTSSELSSSTTVVQETSTEFQGFSHETEFSGSGDRDDDDDDEQDDNKTTQGLMTNSLPLHTTTEFSQSSATTKSKTTSTTVQSTTRASTEIVGSGNGPTRDDDGDDSSDDGEGGSGDSNFTTPTHSIQKESSTTVQGTSWNGLTDDHNDDHQSESEETAHQDTTTSPHSTTLVYVITDATNAQKSTDFAESGSGHTKDDEKEDLDTGSGDYTIKTDQPAKTSSSILTRPTVTPDFEFSEDTTLSSQKNHITTSTLKVTSRDTSLTTNDRDYGGSGDGFTDEETDETSQLTKRSTYFTSTKLTTSLTTDAVEGSGFSDHGDDEDLTGGPSKTSFDSTTASDFNFQEERNLSSTSQSTQHTMRSTVGPTIITDATNNSGFSDDGDIAWTLVETSTTAKPLMLTTETVIDYVTKTSSVSDTTESSSTSSNPPITADVDEGSGLSDNDDEDLSSTPDDQTTKLLTTSSSQSTKLLFTDAEDGSKPTNNFATNTAGSSDDNLSFISAQTTKSDFSNIITDVDYGEEFITTIKSGQITTSTTKQQTLQTNSEFFDDNLTSKPSTSPAAEFSTTHLADGLSTASGETSKADFTYEENFDHSTQSIDVPEETASNLHQSSTTVNGSDFTVDSNVSVTPADTKTEETSETESLYKKILNSLEEAGDNDVNSGDGDSDDDNGRDDVEIFSAFNETLRSLE